MRINTDQYRLAGQTFGSYRCLALVGEGGMGQVFLAEHVRLGRKVALKRLKETAAARPEAVEQFMTEAQAVNRIQHPHIVDITDFVHDDDGVYYLMELLQGKTVAELISDTGPLPPQRVLHIVHQVADALEAAHRADVFHLDVKPSNIFCTTRDEREDYVKLLDFGIATLRGAANPTVELSGGISMPPVTPAYMAPEQVTAEPVDHRADVYSLGVVLYEMLAGAPPFEARSTAEFVHKHMNVTPPRLARLKTLPHRIPSSLDALVADCLRKHAADRPATAEVVRDRIAEVAVAEYGIGLEAGKAPTLAEVPPTPRRRLGLAGLAGVVLVCLGVALVLLAGGDRGPLSVPSPNGPPSPGASSVERRVTLNLRSSPPGVEVLRVGAQERLLGSTPLAIRLDRGSAVVQLRLRRAGYRSQEIRVDTSRGDQQLLVSLERLVAEASPAAMRDRPPSDGSTHRRRRRSVRPRSRPTLVPRDRAAPMRPAAPDPGGTVDPFAQ